MSKIFDFTAGTSTGSILAAGFAKPEKIENPAYDKTKSASE